ncbi:hypothetical protein TNCV_4940051 [Trichonephila clavipes]|nr:hypothetical protein TNCV_4940051 [Trichonephila clavipes]
MRNRTWYAMFKSSLPIGLNYFLWPACSSDLSPIENAWSMLEQRLAQDTLPASTPDQLLQYVKAAWTAVPQGNIQG